MPTPKSKTENEVVLSASKIKTLQDCSWKYYCSYVLKLPKTGNDGSKRGSVCHSLFEVLLNPRHRHHYDQIMKRGSVFGNPAIKRMLRLCCKREKLTNKFDDKGNHNAYLINEMIMVGLRADFFCENTKTGKKAVIESPETEFKYEDKKLGYKIFGFIDKIVRLSDHELGIYDYKTSSKKYEGDEKDFSMQAAIYALYAKRVRNMDAVINFLFLRFPQDPLIQCKFTDEELVGLETFLSSITKHIKKFSYKDAISNLAIKKGYPKPNEGFSGALLCGYTKYPGHVRKDGTPYWHCEFKFAFDYYALYDEAGKLIKTAHEQLELANDLKQGYKIKKMRYDGCPGHKQTP